jgi:hypothetical protein
VQAIVGVPTIVNRLRLHLLMPGQPYDTLTSGMHLLAHIVEALSATRGTDAVYCLIHGLFQPPLAKLMSATSGVKSGPLAEKVVSLMDKLLQHANQVQHNHASLQCVKITYNVGVTYDICSGNSYVCISHTYFTCFIFHTYSHNSHYL